MPKDDLLILKAKARKNPVKKRGPNIMSGADIFFLLLL